VLAFGTILVVDWLGLLWLMGKVHMHESPKLETAAKPLIWGGLALLLASGALIQPDLTNPETAVKLGLRTHPDAQRFEHRAGHAQNVRASAGNTLSELGRRLRTRLLIALSISQACWWTAVLIGLVNSTLGRWTGM
jgi:hypothetical protein